MAGIIHRHPIYDDDPHFIINPITRKIRYEQGGQLPVLVQGDHNSEVYTFEIPRYIDRHDMMLCDVLQIHYINIEANNNMNRNSGIYEIKDMQVSPDDENICVFSWTISANATAFIGALSFSIRLACSEASKLTYVWNSSPYNSIPVSETYNNSTLVVEQYADVLETWYWEFVHATTQGVNVIEEAKREALTKIGQVGGIIISDSEPDVEDAVAWLDTDNDILRIRRADGTWDGLESIKGESGSIENAVGELGTSEELVINQKKITEEIERIDATNSEQDTAITGNATKNAEQDVTLAEHNLRITALENYDAHIGDKVTELETNTSEQDTKISNIETKNSEQDTKIINLEQTASTAIQVVYLTRKGTGTYGESNPCKITGLSIKPILFSIHDGNIGSAVTAVLYPHNGLWHGLCYVNVTAIEAAHNVYARAIMVTVKQVGDTWTIEWFALTDTNDQFNNTDQAYYITILGTAI